MNIFAVIIPTIFSFFGTKQQAKKVWNKKKVLFWGRTRNTEKWKEVYEKQIEKMVVNRESLKTQYQES